MNQLTVINDMAVLELAAKGRYREINTKFNLVEVRRNSTPICNMNEGEVIIRLSKVVIDTFEFFNTKYSDNLPSMIVDEILSQFGKYSALEIVRAIMEGRRNQKELYGRLSAIHFLDWLAEYAGRVGDAIAEYERNKRHEGFDEGTILLAEKLSEKFKVKPERPKLTHEQKVEALRERYEPVDEAEQARREHMRNWTFEDGPLKEYMDAYDESIKNQKQ